MSDSWNVLSLLRAMRISCFFMNVYRSVFIPESLGNDECSYSSRGGESQSFCGHEYHALRAYFLTQSLSRSIPTKRFARIYHQDRSYNPVIYTRSSPMGNQESLRNAKWRSCLSGESGFGLC